MIYLDNAASSLQKPEAVLKAVCSAMAGEMGNPGRGAHKAETAAAAGVEHARYSINRLIRGADPKRVIFTLNCTDSLNLALFGFLKSGDHVITSQMEHNSVVRPLKRLEELGVELTMIPGSPIDGIDPWEIKKAIKKNTKLVAVTHVSNAAGTVNDIGQIGKLCRSEGVFFLVDGAQSMGMLNIDVEEMCIDLLAFPGHKGLFGPQGTGGLYIGKRINDLKPLRLGGTGSFSELLTQPEVLPDRYESGTMNVPGIVGLGTGVDFILEKGIEQIYAKGQMLTHQLYDGLSQISGVTLYGPPALKRLPEGFGASEKRVPEGSDSSDTGGEYVPRGAVVSFNINGLDPQEVSGILDGQFKIASRAGLHCAPLAHKVMGTFEGGGTVRLSPDYFNTQEEIELCLEAVEQIAAMF